MSSYKYEINLRVLNSDYSSFDNAPGDWKACLSEFLEELEEVPELALDLSDNKQSGARGPFNVLNEVILYGVSIGAFSAIYVLARDIIFKFYKNASIELVFPSGDKLTLKNLTEEQAREKLKQHQLNITLEHNSASGQTEILDLLSDQQAQRAFIQHLKKIENSST